MGPLPFESLSDLRLRCTRLNTFKGWPYKLSPERLTDAGFFWTRDKGKDKTECYFCNLIIGEWNNDECPMKIHSKYSKSCSLVNNKVGSLNFGGPENGYTKSLDLNYELYFHLTKKFISFINEGPHVIHTFKSDFPKHDRYIEYDKRLSSYQKWEKVIPKEKLAEAGFYYTGIYIYFFFRISFLFTLRCVYLFIFSLPKKKYKQESQTLLDVFGVAEAFLRGKKRMTHLSNTQSGTDFVDSYT